MFSHYFLEIKNRILLLSITWISSFIITYYYKKIFLFILIKPCLFLYKTSCIYFIYTNLTEVLYSNIIICHYLSMQITIFFFFLHWINFISPALYKKEYINLLFIAIISVFLLIFIFFNLYKFIVPWSWSFFYIDQQQIVNNNIKIYFEPKIADYVIFCVELYKISVLNFQILVFIFIILINLKETKNFIKHFRKKIYFLILLLASIITPPDILSQLIISFITIVIYEFLVLLILIRKYL